MPSRKKSLILYLFQKTKKMGSFLLIQSMKTKLDIYYLYDFFTYALSQLIIQNIHLHLIWLDAA